MLTSPLRAYRVSGAMGTEDRLGDAREPSPHKTSGRGTVLNTGPSDDPPAAPRVSQRVRLIDVQLVQEGERLVEGLEEGLVVLDHLAAHVNAKLLLVAVQLIAIEHVSEW